MRCSRVRGIVGIVVAFLLAVFAGSGPVGLAAAQAPVVSVGSGYKLDIGDRLHIAVYDEPTLTGYFVVSDEGKISFPLIGEIAAKGRQTGDIEHEIHDRLASGNFVNDAKLSVELVSYRPYYILGEVNRPGQYPYSPGIKLQQAIAAAGGYTYRANRGTAFIQEGGEGTKERRVKIKEEAISIKPGDVIRIGERYL